MHRTTTFALVSVLGFAVPVSGRPGPAANVLQGSAPEAGAAGQTPAAPGGPIATLTSEDRETVELIRSMIAEEDRDGARGILREVVAGLGTPVAGREAERVVFLAALDQLSGELGSLQESLALRAGLLELLTRLLAPDDADLLRAKLNLGGIRYVLGDVEEAHELFEEVHLSWTRRAGPDDLDLLQAKGNLAATRKTLGDLAGACELEEVVLVARTRLLAPDAPDLLLAKQNLAGTRLRLGDIAGARELLEAVLAARTRVLPSDHPDLLDAKLNLGAARYELGDFAGAQALFEEVRLATVRLLPPEHPQLLLATQNLANTEGALGDFASAHELHAAVLAARTRVLPTDHPDLLTAKLNLAGASQRLGDLASAHELAEEVLGARTRLLKPEHPALLAAQMQLAATKAALGDFESALALQEAVLEARNRLLPSDHRLLVETKSSLAGTRYMLRDLAGTRALVSDLLAGARVRARALRVEALRPAREGARHELSWFADVLSLPTSVDPELSLEPDLFATLENLRLVSLASAETAHAISAHPELEQDARRNAEIRSSLNDLAAEQAAANVEDWQAQLLSLTEERDRAERELRQKLAAAGFLELEIDATALGARLTSGTAAAAFLRYSKQFEEDPTTGETPPARESLLAFVVQPRGAVRRIELGPASELQALCQDWRAALGRPVHGRGLGTAEASSSEERLGDPGRRLRERVFDPILAVAEGVHTLHVELDDALFLVPLDALPLEDGLVGERVAIRTELTLARLLRPARGLGRDGGLTLVGSIDYDAGSDEATPRRLDAVTPPLPGERSASAAPFSFLPGTTDESAVIARLYALVSEKEPTLLAGDCATKAALHAAAPKTRFLHLATHGWFASESFKSQLDSLAEGNAREAFQRARRTLIGFAPETLCGLALSGANRGKDALGRLPGILTAEELAAFDLRNCELAVLSACETNVGIRRAGQGIQSLQTALHAAGARTAITSLWKVDDAATRRLFELFYAKLWKDKLGKAVALWQAKMALRAEGHPPRDWAGWVLSGDPD